MGQFKVGDKVRVKDKLKDIPHFEAGYMEDMDELIGQIVTIKYVNIDGKGVKIEEDTHNYTWDVRAFEPYMMSKDELQDGDIVTLRNGDKLRYNIETESFDNISDDYDNNLDYLYELNDDMTYDDRDEDENDIMKVERPTYHTVFEREETVKEMTIAEISKALGYEVKIVKEAKDND